MVKREYRDLLDAFYAEVSDYIPLEQMNAARKGPEYFLRLIDLALANFIAGMDTKGPLH